MILSSFRCVSIQNNRVIWILLSIVVIILIPSVTMVTLTFMPKKNITTNASSETSFYEAANWFLIE
jgi:hypothetical protein